MFAEKSSATFSGVGQVGRKSGTSGQWHHRSGQQDSNHIISWPAWQEVSSLVFVKWWHNGVASEEGVKVHTTDSNIDTTLVATDNTLQSAPAAISLQLIRLLLLLSYSNSPQTVMSAVVQQRQNYIHYQWSRRINNDKLLSEDRKTQVNVQVGKAKVKDLNETRRTGTHQE